LYAEADKPQQFFPIVSILFVIMLVGIAILTGVLGYLAFGASCDSVILLNLPNKNVLGVLAKLFYCFTIMGSFVIVI
jgi:hypothetical protein